MENEKSHTGVIRLGDNVNTGLNPDAIGLLKTQWVHYPDCQQLTIWLPEYGGKGYGQLRVVDEQTLLNIEEALVSARLNGSIQILFDTLPWPPGQYRLEIEHPKGGLHVLFFEKYAPNAAPPEPVQVVETGPSVPIVYRDGWGNVVPDEDLIIREKVFDKMRRQFSRRLEFSGTFHSGTITYVEEDLRIDFYHEMYGGAYHFGIDIPAEKDWESRTKTPLSRRADIIDFLANEVQRQQASSWRFTVRDTDIVFHD